MKNVITLIGMIALIVVVVVAGPLLLIWALNTLFPVLAIPYTVWTWLAALILGATVSTTKVKR
jgi:hypothetical protein